MNHSRLFKSLADPTRLSCVLLLHTEGELCVCELVEILNESQPKISRHLAQLRNNGLVMDRRKDQWVFYSINPALPEWMSKVLSETARGEEEALRDLRQSLHDMKSRPSRC